MSLNVDYIQNVTNFNSADISYGLTPKTRHHTHFKRHWWRKDKHLIWKRKYEKKITQIESEKQRLWNEESSVICISNASLSYLYHLCSHEFCVLKSCKSIQIQENLYLWAKSFLLNETLCHEKPFSDAFNLTACRERGVQNVYTIYRNVIVIKTYIYIYITRHTQQLRKFTFAIHRSMSLEMEKFVSSFIFFFLLFCRLPRTYNRKLRSYII